jgi:hypothetical protein
MLKSGAPWVGILVAVLIGVASMSPTQAQIVITTPAPAPAPAPAPGAIVRDLVLAAAAAQVSAGGSVTFRLSFTLAAQQARQVETGLAWRVGGNALQYGPMNPFNAVPGQNSDQRGLLFLRAPATVTTAFDVQVYGVVRVDGTVYNTQTPAVVTMVPGSGAPTPNPPAPAPQPTQALAPPAPPGPAENPSLARLRAALTGRGLRVREIEYIRQQGEKPPRVWVVVDADYTQPSSNAVLNLGSKVHATTYQVFPLETQETSLAAAQVWQRYLIVLWARAADITTLIRANQAATSDAQRDQAWNAFVGTLRLGVYDLETGQQVDVKDFMNRNFAR